MKGIWALFGSSRNRRSHRPPQVLPTIITPPQPSSLEEEHAGISDFDHPQTEEEESDELELLENQFKEQVLNLRTRIGLVPNYFITRGEASSSNIWRKTFAWFLKLFQPTDFRDLESYKAFLETVTKLERYYYRGGGAFVCEEAHQQRIQRLVNQPLDRNGNTALHLLIQKRQLKFVKLLLLYFGKVIDLSIQNKRKHTVVNIAFDRLEVEIVFLLCLYGANESHHNPVDETVRNSLGYMEWITTDMLSNLDTGRWLNQHSVKAVMHDVLDHDVDGSQQVSFQDLLAWAEGESHQLIEDTLLRRLGQLPQLFAYTPADGCDAITNHEAFGTLMRHLFSIRRRRLDHRGGLEGDENENSDLLQSDESKPTTLVSDLESFLKERNIDQSSQQVAGRTIFFQTFADTSGATTTYALKLSKSFEEDKVPHPLVKEASMDSSMMALKETLGLLSEFPTGSELLLLDSVPVEMRQAIANQRAKGYHPFELSDRASGITALLYRPPLGYTKYANDPSLTIEECRFGVLAAIFDYAVLARQGLYHGALVDIQHDSAREQRPHLWSFESFLTRFRSGAGRIDRGLAGIGAPNVRASGLGDLKHIFGKSSVVHRYDPSHIHAQHNILYDDSERYQVSMIEQLGAGLFATVLLIASSWEGRKRAEIEPNIPLAKFLEEGFATFLRAYLQVKQGRAQELLCLMGTNFDLMAEQIKLFVTDDYVGIAETSAPKRPVFGALAKVFGSVSHPTAFVHFCQRSGRDLAKPGYSISEIAAVFEPQIDRRLPEGFPRIDTSMMRCSPTWKNGHGWVNEKGQRHLGSYEGALPMQQIIRDLYAVVYLSSMIMISSSEC